MGYKPSPFENEECLQFAHCLAWLALDAGLCLVCHFGLLKIP